MPGATDADDDALFRVAGSPLEDAAASVLAYFGTKSDRDRAIITERIIGDRSTLVELGDRFGVTRERIRQIEKKLVETLVRFRSSASGEQALPLISHVRAEIGTAIPKAESQAYFNALFKVFTSDKDRAVLSDFCLWAAGPFRWKAGWGMTRELLDADTRANILAGRTELGWISPEFVRNVLSAAGIRVKYQDQWMEFLGFVQLDGGWLPRLSSIPARAEQILRYTGNPMTAEELLPLVDCESARSLRNRLSEDSRFMRINRQGQFALREWSQYDEYSGISEEISQEITKQGGSAEAQYLVSTISARYGVKARSVALYLSAPMFVKTKEGRIRLREAGEMQVIRSDPKRCAGLYRVGESWVFRVRVSSDSLRGSGRPIPAAVATTLGCQPGSKKVFKSQSSEIVISWPAGSATGPNLGSIRTDIETLGADVDDYLFLAFSEGSVSVRLLRSKLVESASHENRLALLVGLGAGTVGGDQLQTIAGAIGFPSMGRDAESEDIHGWLMQRNEVDLARLISLPSLGDDVDILSYLEGTLGLS